MSERLRSLEAELVQLKHMDGIAMRGNAEWRRLGRKAIFSAAKIGSNRQDIRQVERLIVQERRMISIRESVVAELAAEGWL